MNQVCTYKIGLFFQNLLLKVKIKYKYLNYNDFYINQKTSQKNNSFSQIRNPLQTQGWT